MNPSRLLALLTLFAVSLLPACKTNRPAPIPVPYGEIKTVSPADPAAALNEGGVISVDKWLARALDPEQQFMLGVESEATRDWKSIRGNRIALITDKYAYDQRGVHTVEHFEKAITFTFANLLLIDDGTGARSPQLDTLIEAKPGLPVFELGAENFRPAPAHYENISLIVFDANLRGPRYDVAAAVLGAALEQASLSRIPFVVFDRPLLMSNTLVDGPTPDVETFATREAFLPVPTFPSMTPGELATLYNTYFGIQGDLRIVPMEKWKREDGPRWLRKMLIQEPSEELKTRMADLRKTVLGPEGKLELATIKEMQDGTPWKRAELRDSPDGMSTELVLVPDAVTAKVMVDRLAPTSNTLTGLTFKLGSSGADGAVDDALLLTVTKASEVRPVETSLMMRTASAPDPSAPPLLKQTGLYGTRGLFEALSKGIAVDTLRERWSASEPYTKFLTWREKSLRYTQ